MARSSWRYIEVSFDEPGEDTMFRAHVVWADSPEEAMVMARASTLAAHPYADNIELYRHQTVTPQKAEKIRAQMRDGSWSGLEEAA